MNKKNSGLTLIEVILTLAMTSFVLLSVFGFMMTHINNNIRINDVKDIQYNAKKINRFLADELSQACSFDYEKQEIVLLDNDNNENTPNPRISFIHDIEYNLYYKYSYSENTTLLAKNVKTFNITTPNANNVRYEIILEKNESTYNFVNLIYMRNSEF